MNNWLQNIKGQITELATEVLNDATEEGQVSTTSELQIEKKKSTECELLYLAEKAKCEALEKKLNEQEDQLYSVSIEGDAVKEKFMGMVSDRDEIIRRLEREMERLKFNQESQQGGDFQNIELNSDLIPKEGIEKEISKLKEKHENEISAILAANASNVNLLREDYERRIEQLEAWNALNLTEPVFGNNDKLLDDLNKLKEENNSKNTTISTLSTQIEDKNILIVQLEDKLNKLINEVMEEKNNEEINKLKREKEELLNKIEILENKESIETFKNDLDEKTELALKEAERKLENTEKELNEYKTEKINLLSELEEIKLIYEKNNSSLTEEIKLLNNLIESKQKENENLFEKISNELINVKEDNLKLIEENSFLQKNLNDLMDVKLLLNKSEDKLSKLEEKMVKMEEEHFNEIEQIKQEKNVLLHQIEELNEENKRNDEKLLLIGSEEFKPSSDSETSNNADWEKMGKEEIEGVVSSSTTTTTTSEIKEGSKSDIKYLRKRKIEINEQSIQTDDQLFSSSFNLSENIELKEEITILLNKIDKLEEQLLIEEMNKRKLLLEKEEIFEKFFNKENELIKLKDEFNLIIEEEKKENFKKILEENETFKNKFCEEMDKLRVENDEKFKKTVEDEENQKLSLINENIQLKSLLENKHFECQKYYSKLEEFSQNCQNLNQKLQESLNENLNIQANLEAKNGKIVKLESELTRLKEHLLGIEEISSKEAIAAEERETELRRQLREFKNKFETDESLKEKNLENYKNELEQLKVQLQVLETEKIHLTSILNEKESSLAETKNALLNLQIVLKDLADEQKTEKQRFEGEIRGLKEELKTQNEICKQFLIKEEELKMTKTINLDHLNSLESQLKIKNNLIDELENQLEEFRILQNKKDENFENSSKIITTKKIDETTLKQLFLSFFMAEKSKQPEIAIVMSKILGYNQQEQEQLQKAINSSSYNNSSSWFTFGTTSLPQPFARKEISLTEQFIRFLEQESIDNTRSMLALPETSKRAFLLEESSPSTTTLRSSSSSTDLQSILDS